MDILLGLLFWLAIGAGLKSAWDHAKADRQRSRSAAVTKATARAAPRQLPPAKRHAVLAKHAVGWWGSEIRHGFPVHRTGWHAGWLAHKTEMTQRQARREEERTTHLETRASFLRELAEHRRRQVDAEAEIERHLAAAGQVAGGRQAVQQAGAKVLPFPVPPEASTAPPPLPADGVQPTCPASPDPPAVPSQPADPAGAASPAAAQPVPATQPDGATPMAADTNYTEAYRAAQQIEAEADAEVNDARFERVRNLLEGLAGLALDPATLGEAAEIDDALRAQQKAAQATADAAAAFRSGLQTRHGGIKEAVDSAPIAEPADKEFYAD